MKKLYLRFVLVFFAFLIDSASPQWSTDPNINTPICEAVNKQIEVTICSNGQGGAFMVWRDYRNNSGIFEGDLYAQQLDFSGNPLWVADGKIINNTSGGQFRPKIISDENGGAIIVWAKSSSGFYGYDLYAQRIDADGNLLWNPNGVAIAVSSATDSFHEIISDGNGGAIVTWTRVPSGGGVANIYAQKVDADGNVLWTNNGVAVCLATGSKWPKLTRDLNGGAIIVWEDSRNDGNIYAQRINENGIAQWTTDGVAVCANQSYQTLTAICSDGSGGAVIVWKDNRSTTSGSDIYGQKIDSLGQLQWATNGIQISFDSEDSSNPLICSDNTGFYIVWEVAVGTTSTDISAQKMDSNGNLLWGSTGVTVSSASSYQQEFSITNNSVGGVIVAWQDLRENTDGNIYAQWIDREGNLKWVIDGKKICGVVGEQSYPALTTDGLAGAIISWWDLRNGSSEDIYAQNIDYRGELGTTNNYYQRNNLNKVITDGTPTSDTLIIPLLKQNQNQEVFDITVKIGSVIHNYVSDLEFTLTHNGIFDTLIYRVNGNGRENFFNTYLNDNLGISFEDAIAPFTGVFNPHNSLANFISSSVSGEWILTVTDHKSGDDGILQDWGLLISESTLVGVAEEKSLLPQTFYLYQNYPNPFNPSTKISWQSPVGSWQTLKVYDILGNEIATLVNEYKPAGSYEVEFNTSNIKHQPSSGVYFYRLQSGDFVQTRKMIYLK